MSVLPIIDFRKKLIELNNSGFVKSQRRGPTGIGKTLEELFGVPENNTGEYDFSDGQRNIELKSQRKGTSSNITLFTLEPHKTPLTDAEIVKRYGYSDKNGRQALYTTMTVSNFNQQKLKVEVDYKKGRINIVHDKNGILCYYDFNDFEKKLRKKISGNMLLVRADTKIIDGIENLHYNEAYLLSELNYLSIVQLIARGEMVVEFRMHLKPDGSARNHGTGFRLNERHIAELYSKREKII